MYEIVTHPTKPWIHYHYVQQGTDEWHQAREDNYTGSNAYKLLSSMLDIDYAKAHRTEFQGNFWTKRGHVLEDQAARIYSKARNAELNRPGFIANDKYPGCIYSPDWSVCFTIGNECKSFSPKQHKKLIEGDIDLKILAQIYYGWVIAEFDSFNLVPYNPGKDESGEYFFSLKDQFKIIPIPKNRKIISNFKNILAQRKVAA